MESFWWRDRSSYITSHLFGYRVGYETQRNKATMNWTSNFGERGHPPNRMYLIIKWQWSARLWSQKHHGPSNLTSSRLNAFPANRSNLCVLSPAADPSTAIILSAVFENRTLSVSVAAEHNSRPSNALTVCSYSDTVPAAVHMPKLKHQ